ncbi:peptide ABC transporter substrate-binding protein [Acidisoma cellulosilytica]|uniref:Peptide ABC transporter substrate-binding protein n=1 Tax=Acidisoma cellulosilyticum TaxID=2802395 RepID=A0A963Z6I7_9PROT|nr:peptide ABC transporter substrate-binding protein [Acidisoma cellulosilyticum]MCB8883543.1 peptide ABC transporter substrate-binding protein [Acidisoma cellulosilyticum]
MTDFFLSRRKLMGLALAAGAAPLLPASAFAASSPPDKRSGQIIAGISQEPTVFNPILLHIEVDEGVYMNLFSPLWSVDPKGSFVPELAAEVPTTENGGVSADGLHWHLKLRPGVTWHDGTPFTADDVKFTLDLINTPGFPAFSKAGHELVRNITILSPTEIKWDMVKAFSPYMSILSWTFLVPKHKLEGIADYRTAPFNNAPIGTGPFKWESRVPGDHITLAAYDKFYGKGPYVDKLVFKYVPDLTVLYTQFRTGDIDYIGLQGISDDHYAEAVKLPGRIVSSAPEAFIETFDFDLSHPIFAELPVRQAIYAAIDKDSIITDLYYGLPKPTESYLPTESWAFNPDLPKHSYDEAAAKKLLDDAGWKPGAGGIREKNGLRLSFTNSTTAGNHLREQVQQLIQQTLQDIGVEMKINNLPPAVMWGDFWMQSKFETAIAGLDFMTGPDPSAPDYFDSHSSPAKGGSGQNTFEYSNPAVDKLLDEGAAIQDQDKRKPIYQQIQAILRNDLPFLPIFQYSMLEGTKSNLVGYAPNVNVRSNCWNIRDWYWAS